MWLVYLALEVWGLVSAFGLHLRSARRPWDERVLANSALQWRWVGALFGSLESLFRLRVEVEGADLASRGPYLLLVRHVSVGDTLLPSRFVSTPYSMRLRFVLKHQLLYDPCLDVVGQRIPNVFVKRGGPEASSEIAKIRGLAQNLGPRDAVLLYPEGTRFSPAGRQKLIEKYRASGDLSAEQRTSSLTHVMPPRMGGFLAVLEAAAPLDVVILSHHGLDQVRRISDLWNGTLLDAELSLSFRRFEASTIPSSRAEREAWLHARWSEVDEWVRERTLRRAEPER